MCAVVNCRCFGSNNTPDNSIQRHFQSLSVSLGLSSSSERLMHEAPESLRLADAKTESKFLQQSCRLKGFIQTNLSASSIFRHSNQLYQAYSSPQPRKLREIYRGQAFAFETKRCHLFFNNSPTLRADLHVVLKSMCIFSPNQLLRF